MTNEEKAIAYFEMYTNLTYDTANNKHKAIVNDITVFIANTSDNLGLASISLNGISESNMSAFPDFLLKAMDRVCKKVKFL